MVFVDKSSDDETYLLYKNGFLMKYFPKLITDKDKIDKIYQNTENIIKKSKIQQKLVVNHKYGDYECNAFEVELMKINQDFIEKNHIDILKSFVILKLDLKN